MLVLKRKEGESILIGEDIEVIIGDISNGYVKLSIKAPENTKIVRKELLAQIREENLESIKNLEFIIKGKGEVK